LIVGINLPSGFLREGTSLEGWLAVVRLTRALLLPILERASTALPALPARPVVRRYSQAIGFCRTAVAVT